jgi:hypothetical protein
MPRMSEMFPSKWLSAGDLGESDHNVTITDCTLEKVGQDEQKWVLWFREMEKGMVLNVTRSRIIGQLLMSDDTDDWIGKQVTIYPGETNFQGEMVATIGVRKKLPRAAKPQPATAARPAGKTAPPLTQAEADEPDDDPPF